MINWDLVPLGTELDKVIAADLGVPRWKVMRERWKRGIGPAGSTSRAIRRVTIALGRLTSPDRATALRLLDLAPRDEIAGAISAWLRRYAAEVESDGIEGDALWEAAKDARMFAEWIDDGKWREPTRRRRQPAPAGASNSARR